MRPIHIIVTCEHGGNLIPASYKHLFTGEENEEILQTHQGWDIGALKMAQKLARALGVKLYAQKVSRMLVDCNRSISNKELFSHLVQSLSNVEKDQLLEEYYYPYRNKIEETILTLSKDYTVLHISVHSFVPVWLGTERLVDVGLLFDDERVSEFNFCQGWKNQLQPLIPDRLVMLNVPYHGADDGFTTYLRKKFPMQNYLGIELEVNHKWADTPECNIILDATISSLTSSIDQMKRDFHEDEAPVS